MLAVERLTGAAVDAQLDALAALRIAVFREFPYLYQGTLAYEREYIRGFASSARNTLVVARAGERVVGAATASPVLDREADSCGPALRGLGYDLKDVYYFGESVLLPEFRGQGIGNAFFTQREASAREFGFSVTAFCAVDRPYDHPARPADYAPHDAFWVRRGYLRRADAVATFRWLDLGDSEETDKPMVFWTKELTA